MKVTNLVLLVLIICGVAISPANCQGGPLAKPDPQANGDWSSDDAGHSSSDSLASSLIWSDASAVFENERFLGFNGTVASMEDLAQVVADRTASLWGMPVPIPNEVLAEVAQFFTIRHKPEPDILAFEGKLSETKRIVETALTHPALRDIKHVSRSDIAQAVQLAEASIQSASGFVFRVFDGTAHEYPQVHLHQLASVQTYFAVAHSADRVWVVVAGSEMLGEFRRGQDTMSHRAEADFFLRIWQLEQWIRLWICPWNPARHAAQKYPAVGIGLIK